MLDALISQSVPLEGYPMRHVFAAADGSLPPKEHLDQIIPLNKQGAQYLWNFEDLSRVNAFDPGSHKYFRDIERLTFGSGDEQKVKKWLYRRGLAFSSRCFLCYQPDTAFILTWKMVIHYSKDLFFGHDVIAWDQTLNWALYYDHNDVFHFGKNRIYDGQAEQLRIQQLLDQLRPSRKGQ